MVDITEPMALASNVPDGHDIEPAHPELKSESPRPLKRRQSSSVSPSVKRPRLSPDESANSPNTIQHDVSNHASPILPSPTVKVSLLPERALQKAKPDVQEERKRGQRLFGGLLNTLSQTVSNDKQKRRLEIEKRQLEKAKRQKAEDEEMRAEREQKMKEKRRKEGVRWERQSMRTRHKNLRAMAGFLSTKTEPKLYYKPWQFLPGDTERIASQVTSIDAQIAREEQAFMAQHRDDLPADPKPATETSELGTKRPQEAAEKTETEGEHHVESSSISSAAVVVPDTTNLIASLDQATEADAGDENGELVEGEEDAVIY